MSTVEPREPRHETRDRKLPTAVQLGAFFGLLGGIALGAVVGPVGILLGLAFGIAVGAAAGRVLEKEERRVARRTRELDDIIGVTAGSIGAGDVPRISQDDVEARSERERWAAEWLTPPPPNVAGV